MQFIELLSDLPRVKTHTVIRRGSTGLTVRPRLSQHTRVASPGVEKLSSESTAF